MTRAIASCHHEMKTRRKLRPIRLDERYFRIVSEREVWSERHSIQTAIRTFGQYRVFIPTCAWSADYFNDSVEHATHTSKIPPLVAISKSRRDVCGQKSPQ